MSAFEGLMLFCFGAAWPFSIYKAYVSKSNDGKSILFLLVVLLGYASGIIHKVVYSFDAVILLYILNGTMVLIDVLLYCRNSRLPRRSGPEGTGAT